MEQLEAKKYEMYFKGSGSEYFGIAIVNAILTLLTLGFYYPWAKAKQLSFLYNETVLENSPFSFHGTGKEMFKGFIKLVVLMVIVYAVSLLIMLNVHPALGALCLYACFVAIIPLAIHGSMRYRTSRTTWRGIRFGYRGDRNELIKEFIKGFLLTIITFGIYSFWFTIKLRSYLLSNIRFGTLEFRYEADGADYFVTNLKGVIFSMLSFGIYSFWYQKELFEFFVDHLRLHDGDKRIEFKSTATGGDFFFLVVVNVLILIFTLGIGFPFVETRILEFVFSKIELVGNVDLDSIVQSEESYTDATGEEAGDFFDMDVFL